jgi:thioredoxin-like negative regulator of GroEL
LVPIPARPFSGAGPRGRLGHDGAATPLLLVSPLGTCPPGRGLRDQILQQRRNHETFTRRTIDVDSRPDLAQRFKVTVVPTIVVVDEGRVACRVEGRVGVPELRDALSPWLR